MSVSLLVVKMVCSLFKFWLSVQCSECRPTIGYNASVYLVAGVGGFKNAAKRNVKTDLLSSCPRYRTKLIKQNLSLL
ncbi:MAG: hypothetical protein IT267_04720 [Saprospiraceae bacterium]|nr:hypothetical protein [Saprospiraceae bacterium]